MNAHKTLDEIRAEVREYNTTGSDGNLTLEAYFRTPLGKQWIEAARQRDETLPVEAMTHIDATLLLVKAVESMTESLDRIRLAMSPR